MTKEQKLAVLTKLAALFQQHGVEWAVGGSLLLYFYRLADDFHDIDLLTTVADAPRVKQLLLGQGELLPAAPAGRYRTKYFFTFDIDGVEVDVMAGMAIEQNGAVHDCSLREDTVLHDFSVNGVAVPLHALAEWQRFYTLMGRPEKAARIANAQKNAGPCVP